MTVQQDLFGAPPAAERVRPVAPSEEVLQLAARLPPNLHFGTSSWSFPGWVGIVYDQLYGVTELSRHGLAAYARHPLLSAVNLDSSFYKPPSVAQLSSYAAQVPDSFRFLVKAYAGLTAVPESPMAVRGRVEPVFLDARFATQCVIEPLVRGLGPKLGGLLFQFSPLGPRHTRAPGSFREQLGEFLSALPVGPHYAVELRDPQILGAHYEEVLRASGAVHCATVHPRMPPVDQQVLRAEERGPLFIRWMLRAGDDYERAGARYSPFNRLQGPDKLSRNRIAALVRSGLSYGRDVYVVAANNAEGSAPLTLLELAKTVVTN